MYREIEPLIGNTICEAREKDGKVISYLIRPVEGYKLHEITLDEKVIDENTRSYSFYTYYLVRVSKGSTEEIFLNKLLEMKEDMLDIPQDRYGRWVALKHYELLNIYKSLKS